MRAGRVASPLRPGRLRDRWAPAGRPPVRHAGPAPGIPLAEMAEAGPLGTLFPRPSAANREALRPLLPPP